MSNVMANGTSGASRAAALERRRALSQNGKAALPKAPSAASRPPHARTSAQPASTPPASVARQSSGESSSGSGVSSASNGVGNGRSVSLARRMALSQGGKAAVSKLQAAQASPTAQVSAVKEARAADEPQASAAQGNGDAKSGAAVQEQALDVLCSITDDAITSLAEPQSSAVRRLCQDRRRALATQGKPAARQLNGGAHKGNGKSRRNGRNDDLTGRAAARAHRHELAEQGRGDKPASRPSGRVRPQPGAPAKVEVGTTLRGTAVTGTQVERHTRVTGGEAGSCRVVTGTEYIGAEQYATLCDTVPQAGAAKVSVSNTSRGQRVSGTEVGPSARVTGDEHGGCANVTGIEYLGAEKLESFCGAKSTPAPAKVGSVMTRRGLPVSGTEVGRSAKVTGDEPGTCAKLTGSQYAEYSSEYCRNGNGTPHKVSVMSTAGKRTVTGTDVSVGSAPVTGDDRGACAAVTGNQYKDLAQYQACNREPSAASKVSVMRTWRDLPVSGTSVERSAKVTGDEYGACRPITGTEYAGPDQYAGFCAADAQKAPYSLLPRRTGIPATGIRLGQDGKVTGDSRGADRQLSGTPYGDAREPWQPRSAQNHQHPLTRGPADAPRQAPPVTSRNGGGNSNGGYGSGDGAAPGRFSVMTPARSARDSSRITGTAYGAAGRITGPVNLGTGLVSGTPEFRYRDGESSMPAVAAAPVPQSQRITGDGREGGFAITGAAWRHNGSVTGTEGMSTLRNPTMRGGQQQRPTVMNASQGKDRERPEAPASRVTGSSGNDAKGAVITYSGGARG